MTPPQPNQDRPLAALLAPDLIALLEESPESVAVETEELHPADLADIAEQMGQDHIVAFLSALPQERAAGVLEYLDEELRTFALEEMSARQAAQIVSQMTPDDRVDTLEELEEEHADEILSEIAPEARRETEALLQWEPDSAGGLMTTEFVSVPQELTVEEALRRVRAVARAGRREAMYTIYATDNEGRLRGVISLRELMAAPEGSSMAEQAWSDVATVSPTADQEEVVRVASNYDLVAVPVVDEQRRILGVVTLDDVIDVLQEEQTEDVQKFGGMEALDEPYMQIGFVSMMRKRAGWLSVLFLGEMLTASATAQFQGELERTVILSLLMPLIISSGGNSGSQATSLIIRAMALGEIKLGDWWRVMLKELRAGLVLGVLLGILGALRILGWQRLHDSRVTIFGLNLGYDYHYPLLVALTIGVSVIGVVTFGSLTGSMLPFLLRRFKMDPASASAPLVATLVDVTGLVIYFKVALVLLRGVLL